jgi:hypothetical protein
MKKYLSSILVGLSMKLALAPATLSEIYIGLI